MHNRHVYLKSFSIIHRFSIIYHIKALKKFDISGHQMGYIVCVCADPGISQEKLSSFLRLNKGSVTKGIRPLVENGYIKRIQSAKDKRAYELYPTEKAKELYKTAEKVNTNFEQILTEGMTKEEQKMLKSLLLKACDNIMEAAGDEKHKLTGPPDHDHSEGRKCCHRHKERGLII